jgi:hypothetical protein
MTTAKEYREFAKECLKWADEAEADNDRNSFLEMARDWTLAAIRLEGGLTPEGRETKTTGNAPKGSPQKPLMPN